MAKLLPVLLVAISVFAVFPEKASAQSYRDPYAYGYSRYPRYPFVDPPRRPATGPREAYITVLVNVPIYDTCYDRETRTWSQCIVGYRQVKRTIRLEWSRQHNCYGYYDNGRFVPYR